MKKWSIFLCCICLLVSLTACGEKPDDSQNSTAPASRSLGVGCVATRVMDGLKKMKIKATAAAVVLDADGLIADCRIDEVMFDVALNGGKPQDVADLRTKGERGSDYAVTSEDTGGSGELTASWREQVQAFCTFVKGKTPGAVSGIAATDGKSTEIAGCDLIITDFIEAVRRASDAAEKQKDGKGALHLAMTASKMEQTSDDALEYDVELGAVTVDGNNTVTGCFADTLQVKMSIQAGVFTTVSGAVETKRAMGDAYGLKKASGIGKEWYEQAQAFDAYAVGKTATQLSGLTLDSDGKTDAISGCTVGISGMLKNTVKAINSKE